MGMTCAPSDSVDVVIEVGSTCPERLLQYWWFRPPGQVREFHLDDYSAAAEAVTEDSVQWFDDDRFEVWVSCPFPVPPACYLATDDGEPLYTDSTNRLLVTERCDG
jgi:hypothetical protein